MPSEQRTRPITIAIAALGGQGGGVLTNWIVDIAEHGGYLVQATSVAGVAQRTGATIYGVEMFPKAQADAACQDPVFALYPVPGDVDIVIAAELAEAARAVERQFVTPSLTTLIASTHRVYAMTEKVALGDGRSDARAMLDAANAAAKKLVAFDMDHVATQTGSVISSVLLGALAGSGALPFERDAYEAAIKRGGKAVKRNLAGFGLGYQHAVEPPVDIEQSVELIQPAAPQNPSTQALVERINAELPQSARRIALEGARRCVDFQDVSYAQLYLDRLGALVEIERAVGANQDFALTREVARYLALRMCYEDTIRVADLKTRGARFDRFRRDVEAAPDQLVDVVEYLHPRIEELCDTLPPRLGRFVMGSKRVRAFLAPAFGRGRNITTTRLPGFLLFYLLAKLRRWRRGTLRYQVESKRIEGWLDQIHQTAGFNLPLAVEIAQCARLIKGYGDTHDRGLKSLSAILNVVGEFAERDDSVSIVRRLREAALADDKGDELAAVMRDVA